MPPPWPRPLGDDALAAGWARAWQALGRPTPAGLRETLEAAWREPHRHHHDATHLRESLALLDRWRREAERPQEVTLALWFHDAVYDARADDNEARSAAWATRALAAAGVEEGAVRRIAALVRATGHDAPPADRDAALLLDIDLAILGSPVARFDRYEREVRKEYGHVPESVWRTARAAVLRGFLARPRLYHLTPAMDAFEVTARHNLAAVLARLAL